MTKAMRRQALFAAVAVAAAMLFPGSPARAQTVYTVGVGAFLGGAEPLPAESMRFYPNTLTVHKGDVVRFTSESFHTATLLPVGQVPESWLPTNAGSTSAPWALIVKDPDEGASGLKVNNRAAFGPQDCGTDASPCAFDGKGSAADGVLNSGLPFAGPMNFNVRIDANPGESIWVLCLVHTHMRMRINVVADDQAASDPAAIEAQNSQRRAFDADWAATTHNKLKRTRTRHTTADGSRVWDVHAGYDNHWASLLAMYPRKLTIKRGDTVRFHFDGLIYELHTATFDADFAPGSELAFACDPDGDSGTQPDGPPQMEQPPFCNDPSQFEIDAVNEYWLVAGDGSYTGRDDFEGSGAKSAEPWGSSAPLGGNASWDLRFTKRSGDKPFTYVCAIHPFMVGKIVVE